MAYYNPHIHHRRSIRLKSYDYSQAGAYFVTILCKGRAHLFGKAEKGKMLMNEAGKMIEKWYMKLEEKFPGIQCEDYIIMPNHIHCIIRIMPPVKTDPCICLYNLHSAHQNARSPDNSGRQYSNDNDEASRGEHAGSPQTDFREEEKNVSLSRIIQWFKTMSSNEYIRNVKEKNWPVFDAKVWQRNYYEHIIRNNFEYQRIRRYIRNNPKNWKEEKSAVLLI